MIPRTHSLTRRALLHRTGGGILAASLTGIPGGLWQPAFAGEAAAQTGTLTQKPTEPPYPVPQNEPALPPEQRVGFAIVGLGKFATQQILPAFSDCRKARVTALVSGDPAKARRIAAQYGIPESAIYSYDTMERLRENAAVDVVYVITPNALHKAHTLAGFKAAKHVLCEKPLATSVSDGEAMIRAGKEADKYLMTAYRAQYEPFNLESIRLCRSGELGRLVTINADHGRQVEPDKDPADKWRVDKKLAGGGSLMDIGVYSLQAARYLTGEEPVEVMARLESPANDPRFREVEATVHWTMRFPSGTLANCASSYDWLDTKRFRVQGSKGWLELDPATDYYRHRLRVGKPGNDETPIVEEPQIKEQNQFALMMDHFAECVREKKSPRTPGEEGLRDLRYMLTIYEAAKSGRIMKF
jgi:predicted dehydrogenase